MPAILSSMSKVKPDNEPDILPAADRGELPSKMEPLLISSDSPHRMELVDLSFELSVKSASLRSSLPDGISAALADLVRAMNCYYSNLIEGHDTHPIDIERALKGDYSSDLKNRNLQLEAEAHIEVQHWIDNGGLRGRASTTDGILEIHGRFCDKLPDDLLWVQDTGSTDRARVVPGELRRRDVQVGQHIAISPGSLTRFLQRYQDVYSKLGKAETILAAAAAHHRLLWIHPFLDGNGRVARLVSYAQLLDILETAGVWSIARGLARQVGAYKGHLVACDRDRYNDLDGRGNLSERALVEFTRFFLATCIDQVSFMENLIQPRDLHHRILTWAEEEIRRGELPTNSGRVLEAVLYRGELPRGEVPNILNVGDRHARRIVAPLLQHGVLTSSSDRAPLRLAFPAKLASRWMPGLFPER